MVKRIINEKKLQKLCGELCKRLSVEKAIESIENEECYVLMNGHSLQYAYKDKSEEYRAVLHAYIRGFYAGAAEQLRDIHSI